MDTQPEIKAMVLCAGYGTRLGSLTSDTPKALLKIGKHPIIAYILANLSRSGITRIGINLHYKPEMIQEYVGDGSRFGVEVTYSYEPELLGTAGAVKKMESFFKQSDTFLVHYGDIITNQDFRTMIEAHKINRALATLLLHQRKKSNSIVDLAQDNRIVNFLERPSEKERKQTDSTWVNSGVLICSSQILDEIPPQKPCDFPKDIFPYLVETKKFFGFPLTGYRCAIDSQERLENVRNAERQGIIKL